MSRYPRPLYGYCLLDFMEHWMLNAIYYGRIDDAVKWARQLAHYALLMNPELAYDPHNIERGNE